MIHFSEKISNRQFCKNARSLYNFESNSEIYGFLNEISQSNF